jgi:hypothetical protein
MTADSDEINFDEIEQQYQHLAWGVNLGRDLIEDISMRLFAQMAADPERRYASGEVAVVTVATDPRLGPATPDQAIVVQRTHPDGALPQGTVYDLMTLASPTDAEIAALNRALDAADHRGDRTIRPLFFAYYD